MKKILFTLLFVILFTQIQNSYGNCISYDPETNGCLLTDGTEDEEKKETQVNKTGGYREKLGFNNEEEYLKTGYIPGNMTESDYVNMIMWGYGNEKDYISFDKANVYKNFQNYKLTFLGDSLKNLENYIGDELDKKIDKVVKEIEKREKVLKTIALKLKKDKSNNDLKNQAKTIGEEILGLKLLFGNHYGLCTVYSLSGDENKLKMCYIDYKKKKEQNLLLDEGSKNNEEVAKLMYNEKGTIFNLFIKKDIDNIGLLYSDIKKFVNDIEKDLKFGPLNINKKQEYIKGFKENFIKENYLISGKEYEFEKFLEKEINILEKKGKNYSKLIKYYLTEKQKKQILSMLNKIEDLQERNSYVLELLKKIEDKFIIEKNIKKQILFRDLVSFLKEENINILNQIDKTK